MYGLCSRAVSNQQQVIVERVLVEEYKLFFLFLIYNFLPAQIYILRTLQILFNVIFTLFIDVPLSTVIPLHCTVYIWLLLQVWWKNVNTDLLWFNVTLVYIVMCMENTFHCKEGSPLMLLLGPGKSRISQKMQIAKFLFYVQSNKMNSP